VSADQQLDRTDDAVICVGRPAPPHAVVHLRRLLRLADESPGGLHVAVRADERRQPHRGRFAESGPGDGVNSVRIGVNSNKLGVNSNKLGVNSNKLGVNSDKMGVNSVPIGAHPVRVAPIQQAGGWRSAFWPVERLAEWMADARLLLTCQILQIATWQSGRRACTERVRSPRGPTSAASCPSGSSITSAGHRSRAFATTSRVPPFSPKESSSVVACASFACIAA